MYEITFKCRARTPSGDYADEITTFQSVVGKITEDTPLEELARVLIKQRARRDVLVVDFDIFEYTKRPISFKDTKGGILLKNKKFNLDQMGEVVEEVGTEAPVPMPTLTTPALATPTPTPTMLPAVKPAVKPIRHEIYEPQIPELVREARSRGMTFTPKKRYPIYEELPDRRGVQFGMVYITEDDNGVRRSLNSINFVPECNLDGETVRSFDEGNRVSGEPQIYTFRR